MKKWFDPSSRQQWTHLAGVVALVASLFDWSAAIPLLSKLHDSVQAGGGSGVATAVVGVLVLLAQHFKRLRDDAR